MKRSVINAEDHGDFSAIYESDHIKKMKKEILGKTKEYFEKIYCDDDDKDKLSNVGKVSPAKGKQDRIRSKIYNFFSEGVTKNYEKEYDSYAQIFDNEPMEEYMEDNPKNFKNILKTNCPIIRRCWKSKSDALKDWQEKFIQVKPVDLLDTISNVLEFAKTYSKKYTESHYSKLHDVEDFSDLGEFNEEEYKVRSVIGSGIKSIITYYLYPSKFHMQVRMSLYGLYFLSSQKCFNLPSRDSEFLMINDLNKDKTQRGSNQNYNMDHNYWYPYDLFMFYSKLVYDEMKKQFELLGGKLDPKHRYIDLYTFMLFICDQHQTDIDVMMSGSDSEIL